MQNIFPFFFLTPGIGDSGVTSKRLITFVFVFVQETFTFLGTESGFMNTSGYVPALFTVPVKHA